MNSSRCGFIALVGRPNVGKSTLLNRLVGQKISITSKKPQTTRQRIIGIKTLTNAQLVFVDTPGLHSKMPRAMNRYMNKEALSALNSVDVVLFMVEGVRWTEDDEMVFSKLSSISVPVILIINKIDLVPEKEQLLPHIQALSLRYPFREIIPISARRGDEMDRLERLLSQLVPESPFLYSETQITDRGDRFRAAEIIREKLTRQLGQELPYALSVEIEDFKSDSDNKITIHAIIWVERHGQKKIVVGRKGSVLKKIGTEARLEMVDWLKNPVHLSLWVKIREGWSDDERAMKSLGYIDLGD